MRQILREYCDVLGSDNLYYSYFLILHNSLILEEMFYDVITLSGKNIAKHLNIRELNDRDEIINVFTELYDPNHPVRNNVETLDSIDEIKLYLNDHPEFYNIFTSN